MPAHCKSIDRTMIPSLETYIIVLPFVFLAGLIDSIAGGGGLISLPAYLAAGVPPHMALANNKFSSTFGTMFSTVRYFRHGLVDPPVAFVSSAVALAGSFIGTRTVLMINPNFLKYILIVLIPAIALVIIIKKEIGTINGSQSLRLIRRMIIGGISGVIIGFYDGFFGPGTGTFLILIYVVFLKYDFSIANGNTKAVNLSSNAASLFAFFMFGNIDYYLAVPAALFGIAGNLAGSKLVIDRGNRIIRPVFIAALTLLFVKIVLDQLKVL